jgi:4-oxalocrotonate tautomerase
MPHVIGKLQPGRSEQRKKDLAQRITRDVMAALHLAEESVSVAMEEISADDWADKVYKPGILDSPHTLYKKPGYTM